LRGVRRIESEGRGGERGRRWKREGGSGGEGRGGRGGRKGGGGAGEVVRGWRRGGVGRTERGGEEPRKGDEKGKGRGVQKIKKGGGSSQINGGPPSLKCPLVLRRGGHSPKEREVNLNACQTKKKPQKNIPSRKADQSIRFIFKAMGGGGFSI